MEFTQQLILSVLGAATTALVSIIVRWFIVKIESEEAEKVKKRMEAIQRELENKESVAYKAVRFAEDFIKGPGKGPERLEAAMKWASEELSRSGIEVTPADIKGFVQSVYDQVKDELERNQIKTAKAEKSGEK